ncbi:AAA family ATPase [Vibrio sp. ABG19]|uniref:AAA family ATPase n=1 Tax=Vibrio sp. ABG19 TaxID=2817385 RepID=UPI00249F762B|nr:AAA family ATPase [Vibrio sp. ABG19]WGY45249.1 AAA family ATPase [Vibrio sp. ABG19]
MIITVGGCKGGPGKSTTTVNLAVGLALQGRDVLVIDADDQLATSKWFSYRSEHQSVVEINHAIAEGNISQNLTSFHKKYEVIIVDVAGGRTIELEAALKVSDLVLCPFEPSQLDLNTFPDFIDIIESAKVYNPTLKERFFLNRCAPLITLDNQQEVVQALSEMPEITLLKTRMYINKYFGKTFPLGLGVLEVPEATKAQDNFNELLHELREDLA